MVGRRAERLPPTAAAARDALSDLIGGPTAPALGLAELTLERRSIAEQVATRLMGMVKSGNLKPGDRLPTEQQMGVALGISRPPLREALKALTIMGVLESRQGGRYTVTDLSPGRLVAPFNIMLSGKDYDVAAHFEARAVVDVELVRLCGERAGEEQRRRIRHLARDGRAFLDDPVAFRLNDAEFHQCVNAGAGNAILTTLAQALYDVALDLRRIASAMPGVIRRSVADHCRIADALCDRDPAAAVAAYRDHLDHVRATTLISLARAARHAPPPPD